ncbi:NAD(P)/FAD-dependent oxidoreductase [Dethiobacter alkaliphilus]|uniref:NAD(P)/FAD-dependent oxidoreductase n=1 Tax=Dethiobacter alkaliphilus TaxID=427926 RepID=UPI0022278697|nr:NAD(P)/FAD-dependent oxidoreductase [Dethiobacter alkaliphilus]MCW3489507.1 NAD(P)/FAD-dependent oxidoreductase [Dethiobacter alkaliphilus]
MEHVDVIVIGAGVVGLAVAAEVTASLPDRQVVLMERHGQFGQETSSRNSEVIHAGIYYPQDSLKARLCVEGKELLYDFCRKHGVPHSRLGKLVIAIKDEDLPYLHTLQENARANGVEDLCFLNESEVKNIEPHIACKGALLSPSTGIIDTHSLMKKLEWQALQGGTMAVYGHNVKGVSPQGDCYVVEFTNPDGSSGAVKCSWLINCAGLNSDYIATLLGIDVEKEGYKIHPCKGEYFTVRSGKGLVTNHLIYPPPDKELKSLGIHLTRNLDGGIRLGPSAFYVDEIDYSVDENNVGDFYEAVKGYLPFLDIEDLEPDMAGIRPKLQGPGDPFRDFIIRHENKRGLRGVINLVGIDSPGLTCCLSIARMVVNLMSF